MRILNIKVILLGALVTALLLFPADNLRALGLGEARVDSYLGQPLDVTIRLIEADSDALDAMTVMPARADDYERLGVPAEALALNMNISVDRSSEPAMIRVRSQRAVTDPVIRFLVDARWSSGRVLREYTLFLDPPTVEVAPPSPVTRPETRPQDPPAPERAQPAVEPAPETRRPAPAEPSSPASAPAIEPAPAQDQPVEEEPLAEESSEGSSRTEPVMSGEIEVAAGQTLWGIATDWRPSDRLTMNQVMLAIFDRNPAAFDGNVNRLMRGARLSLPSVDDVESLSEDEADRRIRQQMQAWRQQMGRTDVPVIAESAVPESESDDAEGRDAPVEDDVVHRLDVIPPESDIFDEGPVVSEGEVRRSSRRLAELEDQMYAEALENDELVRRITSIREAIETREAAGLAVADEELAEFEARLRAAREAQEEAERLAAEALAAEEAAAEQALDDDEIGSYFRQLEEEMADSESGADAEGRDAIDPPTPVESAEESAADQPAEEPVVIPDARIVSSSEGSIWSWLLIGVGVILVGGGAVAAFVLLRRRREDEPALAATGSNVNSARERLQADPENLAAHLGLLKALAARDDHDGFSAALDDMYRQVDNDDSPQWQEALNLAVVQAPDHPLLTPNETGLAADDDDDGLDDQTREMLGILPSSDESEMTAVEPDDYEFDSELDDVQPDDNDVFSTEPESEPRPPASEQDTIRTGTSAESDDDDIEGDNLDLAELSRRLDASDDDDTQASDEHEDDDTDLSFGGDSGNSGDSGDSDSTRTLRTGPGVDQTSSGDTDADDELAEDDPLRLDFEFTERPSSSDGGREETLPLSDDIDLTVGDDLQSDDELDADELGDDLADVDDELVDLQDSDEAGAESEENLDERGDREVEAFLQGESDIDDDADPELSDEDAEVKLDLARAYLSMDDPDSARTLLEEITSGGSAAMRAEARKLLDQD